MNAISSTFLFCSIITSALSAPVSNEEVLRYFLPEITNEALSTKSQQKIFGTHTVLQQPSFTSSNEPSSLELKELVRGFKSMSKGALVSACNGKPGAECFLRMLRLSQNKKSLPVQYFASISRARATGQAKDAVSHRYFGTISNQRQLVDRLIAQAPKIFICIYNRTPNFIQRLKGNINIDTPHRTFDAFSKLLLRDGVEYLKKLTNIVKPFLPHSREMVAKQDFISPFVHSLVSNTFEVIAKAFPIGRNDKSEDLRNAFNVAKILFLNECNPEAEAALNSSINYGLNKVFNRVDEMTEESKQVIRKAASFVVSAISSLGCGAKQKPSESTFRMFITALAAANVGMTNNASLFNTVDQILSKDLTFDELQTKAFCLAAMTFQSMLRFVLSSYEGGIDNNDPMGCVFNFMKEYFQLSLSGIPDDIGTLCGCEDFM